MVTAFKVAELVLLVTFGLLISDHRKIAGSHPLVYPGLFRLLKALYIVPCAIYLVVLIRLTELLWSDWLALGLTVTGTLLVFQARRDIGGSYTWAGHCLDRPKLVTTGIYAYVRHPIYLGIALFIIGGLSTSVPRISWPVLAVAVAVLIFVMVLLAAAARHETRYLEETLGEPVRRYQQQTGAVLPWKSRPSARQEDGPDG